MMLLTIVALAVVAGVGYLLFEALSLRFVDRF
jgi:hypothetical protein